MNMQSFPLAARYGVPNNPKHPALLYSTAFDELAPDTVRTKLAERDWRGSWRGQIYGFHHYHSGAHEVLVVLSGSATVILGGAGGPELSVQVGDMLLLPAGVSHCSTEYSTDFEVMGAYAAGRKWDICRPEDTDLAWAQEQIARVPDWQHDPV